MAAPFFSCLPSIWVVCGAGLSGLLCTLCPSTFGATGQVAAVDGVAGLTPLEQSWWNFVKSSPVLAGKSVGSFVGLRDSEARRDLLRRGSRREDGTHSLNAEDAQVLADALVALLSPGAFSC